MQGILIVNKDEGFTSHDIVNLVRRGTGIKKVGHTGTLDPMATGVLPICIGKATKVASYIQGSRKTYLAIIEFGFKTDTLDRCGKVLHRGGRIPEEKEIINALSFFTGKIEQIPPMYSAIKVDGKKLYELARQDITIERKPREVEIFNLSFLGMNDHQITLRIDCSSGTYIRSLARDLGEKLGTFATLCSLTREKVGSFTLDQGMSTVDLKNATKEDILSRLLPMDMGLDYIAKFDVSKDDCLLVKHGKRIPVKHGAPGFYRVYSDNVFLGLGTIEYKNNLLALHVKKVLME